MNFSVNLSYKANSVCSYTTSIDIESGKALMQDFLTQRFGSTVISNAKFVHVHHLIADREIIADDFINACDKILEDIQKSRDENKYDEGDLHIFTFILLWEIFDLFNINFLVGTRRVMDKFLKINNDLVSDILIIKTYGHDSYSFPSEAALTLKRLFDSFNPLLRIFDSYKRINVNKPTSLEKYKENIYRKMFLIGLLEQGMTMVGNLTTAHKLAEIKRRVDEDMQVYMELEDYYRGQRI